MEKGQTKQTWSIAADAPLQSILDRADTPSPLRQTLGALSWQARGETPVGRALASPRIAPQWVAALLALGATATVEEEGQRSERPLQALLQGDRARDLLALQVDPPGPGQRWGRAGVARAPGEEPIVAAVALVELEGDVVREIRLALSGAWADPARLAQAPARLMGNRLTAEHIEEVAAAVEAEVEPQGDFLGSAEYRRAMARVLARRALEQCMAGGEG